MPYKKHRHFYRLWRKHSHPNGYLFICNRCLNENLYPYKFMRYVAFWSGAESQA